jgi:hypothetical protein
MQFLMADGTLRQIDEVVSADVEDGRLICRDATGLVIVTFEHEEVVAFGESLSLPEPGGEDRRQGSRRRG